MGLHVFIVGSRPDTEEPSDHLMDFVASRVKSNPDFRMARCERPEEFLDVMQRVRGDRLVDVLDMFDHGGPGFQRMGSARLFQSDSDPLSALHGIEIAAALGADHLSDTAQVRLLGCKTSAPSTTNGHVANGRAGQYLLFKLARGLGGRRLAFGTIRAVNHLAFGLGGFHREIENEFLFSSHGAMDQQAPSVDARVTHLREFDPPLNG